MKTGENSRDTGVDLFAPLRISLYWLVGSFVGFLLIGEVEKVDNLFWLSVFVTVATAGFAGGYWMRAVKYRSAPIALDRPLKTEHRRQIKVLVAIGSLYYLAYGIIYAREYGVASLNALTTALFNPGGAYLAKFEVYERQQAVVQANTAGQVITIAAVFATPLIPFLVVYWKHVTGDLRLLAMVGVGAYMAFFLAIGTLSGLGQTLIYGAAALLVVRATRDTGKRRRRRRWITVLGVVAGVTFVAYMSYNQGARLSELGGGVKYRFEPNPIVEAITNEQFARGLAVTSFSPTHGYQGLAYNLETPFEWTHGQGASRALDSYVAQYGLAESVEDDTYSARTEDRMGWPAGQYWATIYPWLASDLSWYGIPLFMFLVGWWTARWWYEAVVRQNRLALLLFTQAMVLVAFIPANNQIVLSRPNLIATTTLLVLYIGSRVGRQRVRPGRPRGEVEPASLGVPAG